MVGCITPNAIGLKCLVRAQKAKMGKRPRASWRNMPFYQRMFLKQHDKTCGGESRAKVRDDANNMRRLVYIPHQTTTTTATTIIAVVQTRRSRREITRGQRWVPPPTVYRQPSRWMPEIYSAQLYHQLHRKK